LGVDTVDMRGRAECNSIVAGWIKVDYTNSTAQFYFHMATTAVECSKDSDEDNYLNALENYPNLFQTINFEVNSKKLKWFYNDNKNYLLFERRN
jgi:hypothetical protein